MLYLLKKALVNENLNVFQATLRKVNQINFFIEEQNVIEYYSVDNQKLLNMIRKICLFSSKSDLEIIEIGMHPLHTKTSFFSIEDLIIDDEINYDLFHQIYHFEAQILFIQIEKENQLKINRLLPFLAVNAQKLMLLVFLTESKECQLLPVFNFNQFTTVAIEEIIEKRKYQGKKTDLIETMYQFLCFQLMI